MTAIQLQLDQFTSVNRQLANSLGQFARINNLERTVYSLETSSSQSCKLQACKLLSIHKSYHAVYIWLPRLVNYLKTIVNKRVYKLDIKALAVANKVHKQARIITALVPYTITHKSTLHKYNIAASLHGLLRYSYVTIGMAMCDDVGY